MIRLSKYQRPAGWRKESYRHYLAAKGIQTKKYAASKSLFGGLAETYFKAREEEKKAGAVRAVEVAKAQQQQAYSEFLAKPMELTAAQKAQMKQRLAEIDAQAQIDEYTGAVVVPDKRLVQEKAEIEDRLREAGEIAAAEQGLRESLKAGTGTGIEAGIDVLKSQKETLTSENQRLRNELIRLQGLMSQGQNVTGQLQGVTEELVQNKATQRIYDMILSKYSRGARLKTTETRFLKDVTQYANPRIPGIAEEREAVQKEISQGRL
jgi:hypothetical protein